MKKDYTWISLKSILTLLLLSLLLSACFSNAKGNLHIKTADTEINTEYDIQKTTMTLRKEQKNVQE